MIYVRMMDLQQLLQNMHSKVTAVQRPALDEFERGAEQLQVIDLADLLPDEAQIQAEAGGYGSVMTLQEKAIFAAGAAWVRQTALNKLEGCDK